MQRVSWITFATATCIAIAGFRVIECGNVHAVNCFGSPSQLCSADVAHERRITTRVFLCLSTAV